jgi:acyl carrier protein
MEKMMPRDKILALIKQKIRELVPELEHDPLDSSQSIVDLGVSSLEFVELISVLTQDLKVKVSRSDLEAVETLDDLVDVFTRQLNARQAT